MEPTAQSQDSGGNGGGVNAIVVAAAAVGFAGLLGGLLALKQLQKERPRQEQQAPEAGGHAALEA